MVQPRAAASTSAVKRRITRSERSRSTRAWCGGRQPDTLAEGCEALPAVVDQVRKDLVIYLVKTPQNILDSVRQLPLLRWRHHTLQL
jgi:hypothetical protein